MPTVADLDRTLADAGIAVDAASLLDALAQVGEMRLIENDAPGPALTAAEEDVLARYSGVGADPAAPVRARAHAAARTVLLYPHAFSTADVAQLLKVSTSRIRHLTRERRLYALPTGRRSGLRFPGWQFDEGCPVPGMAVVLDALPSDMHPLEVAGFFTTPTPDLAVDDGDPATPLRWLRSGGDPAVVADLASAIDAAA